MTNTQKLSRRERQIMDIIFELKEASVQQVLDKLPDPPGYSAVRALLARLVEKGEVAYREQGARYLYYPLVKRETATRTALGRLVKTFFDGSPLQAASALLGMSLKNVDSEELDKLEALIQKARKAESSKKKP